MPRDLVLGNGNLLVNFDRDLNMRDLFYPYVGQSNHINGHRNRLGIWCDGQFDWINEGDWNIRMAYDGEALVSDIQAERLDWKLELLINDAVHYRENIFLKKMVIKNHRETQREIRVFFTHDFCINGDDIGDTALYDPSIGAVYHYKRDNFFLVNGVAEQQGIYQYATGTKRFAGAEGTWRDAEDGILEMNAIAQGSVDSAISFRLEVPGHGEKILYYWMVIGREFAEVRRGNAFVLQKTPEALLQEIGFYWRTWVNKEKRTFGDLPPKVVNLFKTSLLVVRTQIDNRGAVLAANDTDILATNRDHYSYMWPRDGALVANSFDKAGYPEITRHFYSFCDRVLTEGGFLMHKYNPDGSVGSSWHPWVWKGEPQLPIQEDETALVLWALWEFYLREKDLEFIESLYPSLVVRAADFLVAFRDYGTNLPLESYDLWEERRGIFTFTTAAVYGGLVAAANFAALFGDKRSCNRYRQAAAEVKEAMLRYLFSPELNRFLRGVYYGPRGELIPDPTLESSLYGLFAFGVFPADHPMVVSTMKAVQDGLWIKTDVGGIARYTDDRYFQRSHDIEKVPGNPWFICTLWLAQWYIAKAQCREELLVARTILEWVADHTLEGGMLAEQIHPYTGQPLSVAPLTWSHATFINTVIDYVEKDQELLGNIRGT